MLVGNQSATQETRHSVGLCRSLAWMLKHGAASRHSYVPTSRGNSLCWGVRVFMSPRLAWKHLRGSREPGYLYRAVSFMLNLNWITACLQH